MGRSHLERKCDWRLWCYAVPICLVMDWACIKCADLIFQSFKIGVETEVSPASSAEAIRVEHAPGDINTFFPSVNFHDLLFADCQRLRLNVVGLVRRSNNVAFTVRDKIAISEIISHWIIGNLHFPHRVNPASGSLAHNFQFWSQAKINTAIFPGGKRVLAQIYANIGAQLPFFRVLHDSQLVLTGFNLVTGRTELIQRRDEEQRSDYSVRNNASRDSYFNSKLPSIAAGILWISVIVFSCKGYKRFVYDGQFFRGAYVALAWLPGLTAGWLLIAWFSGHVFTPQITENVSAAPGSTPQRRVMEMLPNFPNPQELSPYQAFPKAWE